MEAILPTEEEMFVRAFIVPDKRDRYLQMLANPSKRKKILGQLYHNLDIIAARSMPIANRDNHTDFVVELLQQKGAGQTCYLISPEADLDQPALPAAFQAAWLIIKLKHDNIFWRTPIEHNNARDDDCGRPKRRQGRHCR